MKECDLPVVEVSALVVENADFADATPMPTASTIGTVTAPDRARRVREMVDCAVHEAVKEESEIGTRPGGDGTTVPGEADEWSQIVVKV
jgi:hypothetical protein